MLMYPTIDPVAFHLYKIDVHWYGLMYLVGFLGGWLLLSWRLKHSPRGFTQEQLSDIIFYGALGVILGGRIGYMLFYAWRDLMSDPLLLFQVWKGGMSFHGGLIGVVLSMLVCARKMKKPFLALTDLVAPIVPIGLGAGRIGNFINGELWGRVTDMPWGMAFPTGGPDLRHPSQLYEFLMEGVILFCILWIYSSKPRSLGEVSGVFAVGYGVFRCIGELFREPDAQIGYVAFGWLTEGQLLSLPLILVGIILIVWAKKRG